MSGLQRLAWRLERQHLLDRAPAGSLVNAEVEHQAAFLGGSLELVWT